MSKRDRIIYWTGFCVVLALLIAAPLVLPEFWRRFLTEILIWGLLAMSSDILIGYTGMVSFGHSAFFGLGMYGAAAALLLFAPPNLWLAISCRPKDSPKDGMASSRSTASRTWSCPKGHNSPGERQISIGRTAGVGCAVSRSSRTWLRRWLLRPRFMPAGRTSGPTVSRRWSRAFRGSRWRTARIFWARCTSRGRTFWTGSAA